MTEFNLMNGQAIELTKDGVLIKGNHIEIDGSLTIIKGDKFATVMEQGNEQVKNSYVPIDDEPKIMEPATKSKSNRGLGDITINVKVEVDDSELKQLGEKYSRIGKAITEAFDNGK
ncbi:MULTISPECIES: hypothetical protein [unclassified Leuconostoc]|uniref:hypothetical protein n=1 Tax=unclassified Leuconostoc TaxID=2685106 RepID=UPI001903A609|nr:MULTISPECIES: hypothetical protein [unclassified Leuconostoc]MBK0040295.1 hypothetical protein [Leuconostoc sp. S51]MBK0052342.1 hypothetical protein [Leuconostoc sp. S50]